MFMWKSLWDFLLIQQWIRNLMLEQQIPWAHSFLLPSLLLSGVFSYTHKPADEELPDWHRLLAAVCKPQWALPGETTHRLVLLVLYVNSSLLCNTVSWKCQWKITFNKQINGSFITHLFNKEPLLEIKSFFLFIFSFYLFKKKKKIYFKKKKKFLFKEHPDHEAPSHTSCTTKRLILRITWSNLKASSK